MGINRQRFSRKKGSEWVDWLKDDPVPDVEIDQAPQPTVHSPSTARDTGHTANPRLERLRLAGQRDVAAPAARKSPSEGRMAGSDGLSLSIKVSLPKIKMPHFKRPSVSRAQLRYWGSFTVIVLGLSIGARGGLSLIGNGDTPGGGAKDVQGAKTEQKLAFKPAIPESKKDAVDKEHTYDARRQLYSYKDTLENSELTISQQPLPEEFKKRPEALREVAAKIGATTKVDTAFGPAYIATSANKSSQRVMAVHEDLLMFIETLKTYDEENWKIYLETLR